MKWLPFVSRRVGGAECCGVAGWGANLDARNMAPTRGPPEQPVRECSTGSNTMEDPNSPSVEADGFVIPDIPLALRYALRHHTLVTLNHRLED